MFAKNIPVINSNSEIDHEVSEYEKDSSKNAFLKLTKCIIDLVIWSCFCNNVLNNIIVPHFVFTYFPMTSNMLVYGMNQLPVGSALNKVRNFYYKFYIYINYFYSCLLFISEPH